MNNLIQVKVGDILVFEGYQTPFVWLHITRCEESGNITNITNIPTNHQSIAVTILKSSTNLKLPYKGRLLCQYINWQKTKACQTLYNAGAPIELLYI